MNVLTLNDIAALSGMSRQAIHNHRSGVTKTPLPQPTRYIAGSPVWIDDDAAAVKQWISDRNDRIAS